MTGSKVDVRLTVNGKQVQRTVEPRLLLCDFIRNELRLTGTHVGCAHGVCGACTIILNGRTARSCLAFAVQVQDATIETVESLAPRGQLSPIQQAFHEEHALQCGFCTPGFLLTVKQLLADNPDPSDGEIRRALVGNLCRCTGYVNIVRAVRNAAAKMRSPAVPETQP
jgi:aerobic-type carbon monoxide dehydrogenase small subunit (CoxS/CutS family)